jgi:hypothetical protein
MRVSIYKDIHTVLRFVKPILVFARMFETKASVNDIIVRQRSLVYIWRMIKVVESDESARWIACSACERIIQTQPNFQCF